MANDYKVLYRKYRPTTFDEVIGQKYTISMLKNAIVNDKVSHAYIFTGPRGTGKTSTAKIFAKTINCENAKEGIPCGECNSCLNIENNADIIEIDAASNTGVDEIRELINNVKIAPSFSKYKIYIIDEVHMLTQNAFNALLLTLEEPPSHIVFILATTNIESVPITILSRCQRYDFKKIANEDLILHLKNVCEWENITITEEAIEEIVYLCEGGCRDALSILNQLSTSNNSIDLEVVLNNYGSISLVQIKEIVDAFLDSNLEKLQFVFDKIEKTSVDYKVFIKKMIDQLFLKGIIFKKESNIFCYEKVKSVVFELNDLINKVNINVDPFLLILMILIHYIPKEFTIDETRKSSKKDNVIIEKDAVLEKKKEEPSNPLYLKQDANKNGELPIPTKNSKIDDYIIELKKIRINNCFVEADKSLLKEFKEKWQDFIESIPVSESLKTIVIDSEIVMASKKINIVVNVQKSMVELFNYELATIQTKYNDLFKDEILFIAVSSSEWEEYKKDYIKRLKENYVYKIMEEPSDQNLKNEKFSASNENNVEDEVLYTDVLTIFNEDHVVIQ